MPPSIQRSNAEHWNDSVVTEVKEFEGPHLLPASPGWEKVADYALDWALDHAALPSTGWGLAPIAISSGARGGLSSDGVPWA
jgi:hypothetical protein